MSQQIRGLYVQEFTVPGIVRVTVEALQYACEFAATVGRRYVTTFDWAQDIASRDHAGAPLRALGPCLLLSGFERTEVPLEFVQKADDFDFAISIPTPVWQASEQRLIVIDDNQPFCLALH